MPVVEQTFADATDFLANDYADVRELLLELAAQNYASIDAERRAGQAGDAGDLAMRILVRYDSRFPDTLLAKVVTHSGARGDLNLDLEDGHISPGGGHLDEGLIARLNSFVEEFERTRAARN